MPVLEKISTGLGAVGHRHFHVTLVQFTLLEHAAEFFPRVGGNLLGRLGRFGVFRRFRGSELESTRCRRFGQQNIEKAFFGQFAGFGLGVFLSPGFKLVDGQLQQIPHHGLDIASHIAHFGKLGGFHFIKRRIRQQGDAARNFCFPDTGGADQDDILRGDFIPQVFPDVLAPPSVAQCNGNGAFSRVLADDVFIELPDHIGRFELIHDIPNLVGGSSDDCRRMARKRFY